MAAVGQLDGDGGGDGGLADPALAHAEHQAVLVGLDLVDECRQWAREGHIGGLGVAG